MRKSRWHSIVAFLVFFAINISPAYSYEDAFGPAKKIEGRYFTVYYAPQLDTAVLYQKLQISPTDQMLTGRIIDKLISSDAKLADAIDTIFLRVSDILDMHLYSYHGTIKICANQQHLNTVYNTLFRGALDNHSFYSYDINTIYITAENFSRGVAGHEIAHAIIAHHFVVQPPVKVAEILAGYVEFQLRKTAEK